MSGHWSEILRQNGACWEAVRFARRYKTLKAAWDACTNPHWMLWLLERIDSRYKIPTKVINRIKKINRSRGCIFAPMTPGITWVHLHMHARAGREVRAIFPNPPRFRNGAGE